MPERVNDAETCWCGCPERTGPRSFFRPGHDRVAEAAVIRVRYGGIVEFLEAHGYSPHGRNPRRALEELQQHGGGEAVKGRGKRPSIILQDGKPAAVILDIEEYREMLERLEDLEDLEALEEMRKKPLQFRDFEDFLKEYAPGI